MWQVGVIVHLPFREKKREKIGMTLDEARSFFKNDRYAYLTGITIDEIGDNYSKCSIKIDDRHMNARGFLMGGVAYTLADFSFAVATNEPEGKQTVTVTSSVCHMAVPKGKVLTAECTCKKEGRSICFYRVDITDDTGAHIAEINITGKHV